MIISAANLIKQSMKQMVYHYIYKALLLNKIINGDYDHYDEAAKWDNLFKHKEHYLLKHINYKPI